MTKTKGSFGGTDNGRQHGKPLRRFRGDPNHFKTHLPYSAVLPVSRTTPFRFDIEGPLISDPPALSTSAMPRLAEG